MVCAPTPEVMEPGIFPLEVAPNRIWGGAQGTGEGQGEPPGPVSSGGYHGEVFAISERLVFDFPTLERSLCWLVPLVTWCILSPSFCFLIQLTGIPLRQF